MNVIKSVRTDYYLNFIKDDPVRPHLPTFWRVDPNREVFVLEDNETNEVQAVICAAFCNQVPTDEGELEKFSTPPHPTNPLVRLWCSIQYGVTGLVLAVNLCWVLPN